MVVVGVAPLLLVKDQLVLCVANEQRLASYAEEKVRNDSNHPMTAVEPAELLTLDDQRAVEERSQPGLGELLEDGVHVDQKCTSFSVTRQIEERSRSRRARALGAGAGCAGVKLALDHHYSPLTAQGLRSRGRDVITVAEADWETE